jgi:Zn-dependent peptidase ImmA (M78 family)
MDMLRFTRQSDVAAIDDAVDCVLRRAKVSRPPIDAIHVATALGFRLLWDNAQSGRARIAAVRSARRGRPQTVIYLRPDPRIERLQWAVAHELGESFAGKLLSRSDEASEESRPDRREQLANCFATRLLLPTNWFAAAAEDLEHDLLLLKDRFATASHELIARRMLDLPIQVAISIFDNGELTFRRWNREGRIPSPEARELASRREAAENGRPVQTRSVIRIDAWPIHEPEWRREIVRMELNDDEDIWRAA